MSSLSHTLSCGPTQRGWSQQSWGIWRHWQES